MRALSLLMLWCMSVPATEIQWVQMSARLKIRSPGSCQGKPPEDQFYLAMEMENAAPLKMRLQNEIDVWPFSNIYKWIDMAPSEIAQVITYRDLAGNDWLKELGLNERLLKWILYYPSERELCRLPELATKIDSSPIVAKFDLEGVEEGVLFVVADTMNLKGILASGAKFDVDITLTQKLQPWGSR